MAPGPGGQENAFGRGRHRTLLYRGCGRTAANPSRELSWKWGPRCALGWVAGLGVQCTLGTAALGTHRSKTVDGRKHRDASPASRSDRPQMFAGWRVGGEAAKGCGDGRRLF